MVDQPQWHSCRVYYSSIALDKYNNLYIADNGNFRVRKVTASTGIINTVAGNGVFGYSGDGGPATSASVHLSNISIGPDGSLYIASGGIPGQVRKVTNGIINRWAGTLDWSTGCNVHNGDRVIQDPRQKRLTSVMESPPAPAFYGSGSVFLGDSNSWVMVVPPNQIVAYLVDAGPDGDGVIEDRTRWLQWRRWPSA